MLITLCKHTCLIFSLTIQWQRRGQFNEHCEKGVGLYFTSCIYVFIFVYIVAPLAQLAVRRSHKPEVVRPIITGSTLVS